MKKNMLEDFNNLYSISKTLRFELIPQGKTLENLRKNNVIQEDEHRAESYKKVKKMIDEYHKKFINDCLERFEFSKELLEKYYSIKKDNIKDKKELDKVKEKLRKEVSNCFKNNSEYKKIFGKEIILEILPNFYKGENERKLLDEFSKFTTYFVGFNENRENMYVADEKSTAIAYRLIDENLQIFYDNILKFSKMQEIFDKEVLGIIHNEFSEIMQVNELKEMFELNYYNSVITQKGIDTYNQIIGGYVKNNDIKIKGLNEYINEYKQKSGVKFPKLEMLNKQILSDRLTASFYIDSIKEDNELLNVIKHFSENINKNVLDGKLETLFKNFNSYDLEKIYISNNLAITDISQFLYDDWSIISNTLKQNYDKQFGTPKNEKQEEKKKSYLKSIKCFSIKYLNECTNYIEKFIPIEKYFSEILVKTENGNKVYILEDIKEKYNNIYNLLNSDYNKNLKEDWDNITLIKEYLDSLKCLQLFIKPLMSARYEDGLDKDSNFYDVLNEIWDNMYEITPVYNKVRNYLTGKPYSEDKIKLNFKNDSLLKGWDINKEDTNKSIILRKNNNYYLAILDKSFKGTVDKNHINGTWEKMDYKSLPSPNKNLPRIIFAQKNIEKYRPTIELIAKYKEGKHKKGENFDIDFCHTLIDYFKDCIKLNEDWNVFDFKFTDTKEYNDISEFYKEVEQQGYKINYSKLDDEYINQLVEEGRMYLFQIYNKDFSESSHGKPNLHTLYWKMLFEEKNLENPVYKLNGEAEIFYRKASIEKKVTHEKGVPINNKNIETKKRKQTSTFEYDLYKDKRFMEDKFLFHVPITLNFKSTGNIKINEKVNRALKENDENYIIGIDRGERHLLYLVLIDSKGKIVKQFSLNKIKNKVEDINYQTDYHQLLDYKEHERKKARESWQSIENIKNLKEGYLSQVISKITDLVIEYNAIIVLEDLNFGFMRGRQKFEKQVYQKFEKMLIDKLNYLVKKDIEIDNVGGLLKAYQLTNQFESFRKLGKQSGILYYIPAWNTSKMDPVTGFVNLFYIKYENEVKTKEFFSKMENIRYNKNNKYFEFDIDYNKYTTKAEGTKTRWTLCSYGDRVITFRNPSKNNEFDYKEINLTQEFELLLKNNNIDIESDNLKEKILNINGKMFWESFLNLFKNMLQMRNSINNSEIDYILSPVCDNTGKFYDSRNVSENLPQNADANGAYNIARKGLWIIDQIKNTSSDKLSGVKFAISNKEWLNYIQNWDKE